jgi:hypothetical protein
LTRADKRGRRQRGEQGARWGRGRDRQRRLLRAVKRGRRQRDEQDVGRDEMERKRQAEKVDKSCKGGKSQR